MRMEDRAYFLARAKVTMKAEDQGQRERERQ